MPKAEIAVYRQHSSQEAETPEGADSQIFRLEEAIAFEPDAVIISSPAHLHAQNSFPFIKKGKNVFLEKPLAATASDANELVTAASQCAGFTMVGYVLRFLPALQFIKRHIEGGHLGRVLTAHAQVGQHLPDWRPSADYRNGVSAQKALGGGALLELSHEIDYLTWLLGPPNRLFCSCGTVSDLEIDVEDTAHLLLEYTESGREKRALVQLDFLQRVAHMALQIVGTEGTLQADLLNEQVRVYTPKHPEGQALNCSRTQDGNEVYMRQFDFFFHKSFKNYRPRFKETESFTDWVDMTQAAHVLKLVDLAKESNLSGNRLEFLFSGNTRGCR